MYSTYKDENWLRHKIEIENVTQKEIGDNFGVTSNAVGYYLKKYGIIRPGNTKKKENMNNSKKCRDKDWVYEQFIELDKSYSEISAEFGIGKTTVARWVKRHGLAKDSLPQHRRTNSNPPVEITCDHCGKKREVKYSKYINGLGRYCNESCAGKSRYENGGGEKLMEGNSRFFSTEEGKNVRSRNGVNTALKFSEGNVRTSIEIKMADELTRRGIKYEEQSNLGDKFLLDFLIPEYGIVIECDGDYWHNLPQSKRRDKSKNAYIKACGLTLYRFWEHEINTDVEACADVVMAEINLKE